MTIRTNVLENGSLFLALPLPSPSRNLQPIGRGFVDAGGLAAEDAVAHEEGALVDGGGSEPVGFVHLSALTVGG